ncbi:hypothetical protein ABFS83_08G139500 [Erythranthe nasuta]
MEQNWDAQKMLDLYIYNHLIRRNRHTTAEIFTREANFHPTPVALDPPEGFLSEWWSIFWSVYSARYPEETGDSSSKSNGNGPQHVQPAVLQNPNLNHMQQNPYPTMQRQALPNMLQNAGPTIIPRPNNIGNILQGSNLSTMTPFPGLKLAPFSGFNMTPGQSINRFAVRDLNSNSNFNSQLLNIDQLAGMMPSSSNSSLPQDRVYKNPQLCLTRDNKFGTSLWRSTIPDPTRNLPKPGELKLKHADTGSRMNEQVNLNFNSQNVGVDQLSRFLPFSAICSHSREEIEKKPMQFSLTRDERCGTSASPAHHPPTNIQLKMGPSDTDARMRENAHFGIPLNFNSNIVDVNQLATLMNSSSNFSNYQKNKKRQLSISGGDDKCGTGSKKSSAAEPTHHATKAPQPKTEPAETGIFEQGHFGLSAGDFNSITQLLGADELSCLLPCSTNCRQPQVTVHKKSQLSVTTDKECGTSSKKSNAAERTRKAPKAKKPRKKRADSGSSASYKATSSGSSS